MKAKIRLLHNIDTIKGKIKRWVEKIISFLIISFLYQEIILNEIVNLLRLSWNRYCILNWKIVNYYLLEIDMIDSAMSLEIRL